MPFKALSEVNPAGGLYLASWHPTAFAQTVDCIHDDVTAGGVGDCRIIPPMEMGLRLISRFAVGDVWRPLARSHFYQRISRTNLHYFRALGHGTAGQRQDSRYGSYFH
ncbi:hypothetical protein BD293_3738 [Roseinatronobacter monicus]|uniref:Uncharacterized protein n=1 Tax=Roseinatronobacter monicus TaxID=393481 RepID=A0A543K5L0_9RHOB|nr:hypothetical protein BD293_3738 [Roseinatronobacter monicus]